MLALYLTGRLAGVYNNETAWSNFTTFGYALIPLDLAGHLAHNLFHLLAEGKSVLYTGLALIIPGYHGGSAAILSDSAIQALQFALIGLGLAASLLTAYKINFAGFREKTWGVSSFIPYAALLAALAALNIYLFTLPMSMRM